jgi:hypothetical protein
MGRCAHICAREVGFSQLRINDNVKWGTVGEYFFYFCKKITIAT